MSTFISLFISWFQPFLSPLSLPCPPLPYPIMSWTNLNLLFGCEHDQVRPLWKQLHWNRFLRWHWKPCQGSFLFLFWLYRKAPLSPPPLPPYPARTTQSSYGHGRVWSFRVCFCCGVSMSRLMQGKGSIVPILEKKSWYRGESSCRSAPADNTTMSDVHETE